MKESAHTNELSPGRKSALWRVSALTAAILVIAFFCVWQSGNRFSDEVANAGGRYYRAPNATPGGLMQSLQRTIMRVLGNGPPRFDVVEFRPGDVSDEWLQRHQRELSQLSNLTLVLQNSQISDEGMTVLASLENLISLDLSGTQVSGRSLHQISRLPHLCSLNVPDTQLSPSALQSLVEMPELYALGLDAAQITPESLEHMAQMPKLASLTVYGATDQTLSLFEDPHQFQSISLHDSKVSEESIPSLKAIPGITLLSFSDGELTDGQLRKFKAALPGCYVQHVTAREIQEMRDSGL